MSTGNYDSENVSNNDIELQFLNAISHKISKSIAPDVVAKTALTGLKELVGADIVLLFLREGENLLLRHQVYAKPELKHTFEHSNTIGQCLCGSAAEEKTTIFSLDINNDSKCTLAECKARGISSMAVTPLIHRDEVIGVISLASVQQNDFRKRAPFLDNFANLIAVSLSMSLLVDKLNTKIEALEISEEKLKKSESNYRSVIENIQDVYYRTDVGGTVIMASPSGAQLLGYNRIEELIGRPVTSFWLEPDKRIPFLKEMEKNGKVTDYELTLKHKDGTPIQVSSSSRLYYDGEGKFAGVEGVFRDIRHRLKNEENLRKSQNLFNLLAGNINEVFWISEPQSSKIEYVSPAFQKIWGLTEEELFGPDGGKRWMESILADDLPQVSENQARQVQGHQTEEKFRITRPDGQIRWIRNKAFPVGDETGTVNLITGLAEDITEQEETLRKNRKERLLLDALFESIPVGVTVWDKKGKLLRANKTFSKITGYTQDDITTLDDWFPRAYPDPDYRAEVLAEWQEDIQQDEATKVFAVTCKDKRVVDIEFRAVFLDDGRAIVTLDDISDRRKTEMSLRQSEEKYRSLVETTDTAFVIVDSAGVVLDANPKYIELTGHGSLEEILGRSVIEWTLEEERGNNAKAIQKCFEQGYIRDFQTIYTLPDGIRQPIEVNASVMSNSGKLEIHALCRDISERIKAEEKRKQLEDQIAQAQKMEAVGNLAGGVAHDFNNMLSIILGYSELLIKKDRVKGGVREKIEGIHNAGVKSADLVSQLLAFARKQSIAPVNLDLNVAIGNLLKMLSRLIGENIELSWKPGHNVWPIKMDPAQIDQVTANLVVNARDAIKGIGKIAIKTENIVIDNSTRISHSELIPGDYVLLSISDDGCGMDPRTAEKIFEPFFTTKQVGEGSGLGLSTVYGIAKQNNCLIDCYSEIEKGSIFTLYIPRHLHSPEDKSLEKEEVDPPTGDETVLVVEDTQEVLFLAEKMLRNLGYTVLTADNPKKALEIVDSYQDEIDLLLSDMIMPEMNGLELMKRITPIRSRIKYLFMSGYTADIIGQDHDDHSSYSFIEKPFSIEKLAFMIREALGDN